MTESEFENLAGIALSALESALEAGAPDADVQAKGSGMLEVEFENGSKMIINRHGAAREIWVAAKSGGFHFRPQDGGFVDTRSGAALDATLTRRLREQAGLDVDFSKLGG